MSCALGELLRVHTERELFERWRVRGVGGIYAFKIWRRDSSTFQGYMAEIKPSQIARPSEKSLSLAVSFRVESVIVLQNSNDVVYICKSSLATDSCHQFGTKRNPSIYKGGAGEITV